MTRTDNLNTPSLNGAIGSVGFGVLAFAVAKVVGGFDYTTSGFLAALVTAGSAVFLVLPWGGTSAPVGAAKSATSGLGVAASVPAAPVTAAPLSGAVVASSVGETKPAALSAPRDGKGDDLKTIEGIGPALEKLCHELGIWHFDQIAAWGAAETAWMDANLKGFKGRVSRDKWVAQAKLIAEVGTEEFLRRAKTNDY